ncbi:ABC transporter permease [Carboxylicivirga linearis]|uniref:ABC transporter permease n=1 Tax=Carboxylicivirga linearis TaxID=1628157 RepID=A0ABS5JXK5_9BACT|nr:ABC transporter permease [Carboxylicivirga linearis]MBS2099642.1 ABC transporter permease [Carboxylicivirga linearis]
MNSILDKLKQIIYFASQELLNIVKDSGVVLIFFVATLLYPALYAFVYQKEAIDALPVAVIDDDNTQTSRKLVTMLDASSDISVTEKINDFQQAEQLFLNKKIYGIITIDNDFEKQVLKGEQAHLGVYCDGSYIMHYKTVLTAATKTGLTFGAGVQAKKLLMKGTPKSQLMAQISPVNLVSKPLFNATGGYGTYLMPPIMVLVIQQLLLIGIGMIGGTHRENNGGKYIISQEIKERGWDNWFLGRALSYFIIFMLVTYYLFVLTFKWFEFPIHGNPSDVLILMTPMVLASIFLAMWLSTYFYFRVQSMMLFLFSSFIFLFLSGISWPVEAFPPFFKWLSQLLPSTQGIQGIMKIQIFGANLSEVQNHITALWALTVVFFTGSGLRFWQLSTKKQ